MNQVVFKNRIILIKEFLLPIIFLSYILLSITLFLTKTNSIYILLIIGIICGLSNYGSIIFPLLCYTNLFSLYNGPSSGLVVTDCALITMVICLIRMIILKKNITIYKNTYIFFFIIILYLCLAIVAIFNINQNILQSIMSFRKFIIFLLFPIVMFLIKQNNISIYNIFRLLQMFCLISYFMIFIQYLLLPNNIFLDVVLSSRSDRTRILTHTSLLLGLFLFFYSWLCILKKKNTYISFFVIISVLLIVFLVSITRIYIISLISSCAVILLLYCISKIKNKDKFSIAFLSILFLMMIMAVAIAFLATYSESFVQLWSEIFSPNYIRYREINYFSNLLPFPRNIFGFGLINGKNDLFVTSSQLGFFLSDIGFIGYIFNYGVFGIILFLSNCIYIIKNIMNIKNNVYKYLSISFAIGLLITMMTVYPFDAETFSAYLVFVIFLWGAQKNIYQIDLFN